MVVVGEGPIKRLAQANQNLELAKQLPDLPCDAPAADRDEWIAYINVLDEISKSGAIVPSASAVPDPKEKLRLKDHIAMALEKSGDKEKK